MNRAASQPAHGDLVLVRHAPPAVVPGTPAAAWRLAPGAMELTAALGMALAKVRLRGPAPAGAAGEEGALGPIDAVVASHEPKALATAKTLGLVLGVPTVLGKDLEEHHRTGAPFLEERAFERTLRRFFGNPDVLVFGDETADEAAARFRRGVAAACAAAPGKRLALVTHGTVMALAVAEANGLDPFAFWRSLRMPEALIVRRSDWRLVERFALEE